MKQYSIDSATGMPQSNVATTEIAYAEQITPIREVAPKGTSVIAEPIEITTGTATTTTTTPTTTTTTPSGTTTTTPSGTTTSTTSGSSLPNLGALLGGGASGGAGGGASTEEIVETPKKEKPFPYWILIAGLVGGYLIFRKK